MQDIIISMTSIPSRNGTLGPTLQSLLDQTRKADEIRLYLNDGCEGVSMPDVRCYWGSDHGPVTKLSAALDASLPPDTIVVTADDDILYEPTWLGTLVAGAIAYPTDAVAMAGWNVGLFLQGGHAYQWKKAPATCDVIEGWAGVAYRRSFFGPDVIEPPAEFKWVDDVWISSYLHRRGITRRLVHTPLARSRSELPGLHNREDFVELNRRAAIIGFSK